jgi:hypothetical protein
MALVNMKQQPKREEMPGAIESDEPRYPYGLCISLGKEELAKLNITALPKVGGEMMITAKAIVKSTSAYDTQGEGQDMRVELQITDMGLGQTDDAQNENRASKLYGNNNGTTEPRAINNLQSTMLGAP